MPGSDDERHGDEPAAAAAASDGDDDDGALERDATRQTGDMSLYKIYLSSVGWPIASGFILSVLVMAGLNKLPRESPFHHATL